MRKITQWVKPDNVKGYDQVIVYGFVTPEKSCPKSNMDTVKGSRLFKSLNRKKGKKFAPTRTQIIKPLKLSSLLLKGYPTNWIAELSTTDKAFIRYHAKVTEHVIIPQLERLDLNQLPKNSTVTYQCPGCGKTITRHKRSGRISYPTHTHRIPYDYLGGFKHEDQKITYQCYPVKATFSGITLYIFHVMTKKETVKAFKIIDTSPLPLPHTLKPNYDRVPEYYNNHYEKCLTFNPNRIHISTLGYVKPLSEISDYDRLTVITW